MLQKRKAYRNKKILEFAKGQPCTMNLYGHKHDPETVVAAHSNMMADGKGVGMKADDCFVAFLCADCHYWYDFGRASRETKDAEFHRAMKRTWRVLLDNGILK